MVSLRHTKCLVLLALLLLLLVSFPTTTECQEQLQEQKSPASQIERNKRSTVTIDFGLLLRNLLLKSAQFSSAKANITRVIAESKTTRRPTMMTTTTTTTTTTPAPPPPPPPPPYRRRRPIYGGGWKPYDYYTSGYIPFDYDVDYADAPPATPPRPARQRVRPLPQPWGPPFGQKPAGPYDYDTPPAPRPPPPQQPQPQLPRQQQLSDQLLYQYAQSTDTYSKPLAYGGGIAAAARNDATNAGEEDAVEDTANVELDTNGKGENDNVAIDSKNGGVENGGPFIINYAKENDATENFASASPPQSQVVAGYQEFSAPFSNYKINYAPVAAATPPTQQQQYYI